MRSLTNLWALSPSCIDQVRTYSSGESRRFAHQVALPRVAPPNAGRHIAVIPIRGLITRFDPTVGTPTELIANQLDQALESRAIDAVLFDINSHGGAFEGVPELAAKIYESRSIKPIVAIANSLAESAAYWIGSAASMIWCTPSGAAGGLGAFVMHVDQSKALEKEGIKVTLVYAGKYKIDGNPYNPPSESYIEHTQKFVNKHHEWMLRDIAKFRGTTAGQVRIKYGEGQMLLAKEALAAGMVDDVGPIDKLIQVMAQTTQSGNGRNRVSGFFK